MKAIIGTEDDVLGFGLTGIEQRRILPMDASLQQIQDALSELDDTTTTIFINESLLRTLRFHNETPDTHCIMIPDTDATPDISKIERMAKETLGIDV